MGTLNPVRAVFALPAVRVFTPVVAALLGVAVAGGAVLFFANLPISDKRVIVEFAAHPRNSDCRRASKVIHTELLSVRTPDVEVDLPKLRTSAKFSGYELRDGGQLTFMGRSEAAPLKVILQGWGWRCLP